MEVQWIWMVGRLMWGSDLPRWWMLLGLVGFVEWVYQWWLAKRMRWLVRVRWLFREMFCASPNRGRQEDV